MFDTRFEPLRQMESFTEDMFNRIIAFQEKEHPAWNTQLTFDHRIKGLPLHNLIFSNPDRNPQHHGPTVAHYYPLRQETYKIAQYIKQVGTRTCDIYPGNGFIGSLLAREGLSVTGLQDNTTFPNQIEQFFDPSCYEFSGANIDQLNPDAILASWVPSGENPCEHLNNSQARLLVFIYTEHSNPETGERQTGTADMFDSLAANYELLDSWHITRPKDLLHEIWPDMTPSPEETRITRIYQRKGLNLGKIGQTPALNVYDWEQELDMALLAHEAKNHLKAQGIPV